MPFYSCFEDKDGIYLGGYSGTVQRLKYRNKKYKNTFNVRFIKKENDIFVLDDEIESNINNLECCIIDLLKFDYYLFIFLKCGLIFKVYHRMDSNHRPSDYEPDALPLRHHVNITIRVLKALGRHKPFGMFRHFVMILILKKLKQPNVINCDYIWDFLYAKYDRVKIDKDINKKYEIRQYDQNDLFDDLHIQNNN
ncbi:hypothetical protein NAPIS_ORF01038 [Vairimorpha apis BRL 01]|uniref:Uncharacterized protein n=1 Tax=Vairimorpha apis BRL 01 TaxID=1037528 RepID=T0MK40_9MICR|nr:hypothetical protein NAPIS_ORF01038 [Vairimorpha apis BRL 01]